MEPQRETNWPAGAEIHRHWSHLNHLQPLFTQLHGTGKQKKNSTYGFFFISTSKIIILCCSFRLVQAFWTPGIPRHPPAKPDQATTPEPLRDAGWLF
jgi:hypothetical protein